MPIYEFYCGRCHTLFNFFSARVDTDTRPPCPRCGEGALERRPARFATLRRAGGDEEGPPGEGGDERFDGILESMLEEVGDLGEGDDPRQLAGLFRRLGEASGMRPGARLEEFLCRLEAGEDPESLEAEMEEAFGDDEAPENLFELRRAAGELRRRRRPRVDETLYFL